MSQPNPAERREVRDFVEGLELRAAPEGSRSPGTMVGYAAVFDKESCDLGYFRERLAPGCFGRALATSDVRALVNHDPNQLLGRKSAGTLRLAEDAHGLKVEIDLPDTTVGRDTAESIRRGDMQGQSFSFTADVVEWNTSSEPAIRTVRQVGELFDVGPVTFPAYEETSVAMRSYRDARAAADELSRHEAEIASAELLARAIAIERDHDHARLRLMEVF